MNALAALVTRHIKEARRAPGAAPRAILAAAALALAAVLGSGGMGGSARGLAAGLALLTMGAAARAASSAGVLPADRGAGRRLWLGTLAPPAVAHRLAAVGAGLLRVGAAALVGGLVLTLALAVGPGLPHLSQEAGPVPEIPPLVRAARGGVAVPFVVPLAPRDVARRLHLDLRPVLLSFDARPRTVLVDATLEPVGVPRELVVPTRGVLALDVPPGATGLRLVSHSDTAHLRVVSARLLEPSGIPPALVPVLAALLVALVVASVVPWATFVARFTSAPTAAGVAGCLVLLGVVGRALLDLVADTPAARWATTVLEGVVAAAPDLGLITGARALLEARVPEGLGPHAASSTLYLLAGLVLVALPGGESRSEA